MAKSKKRSPVVKMRPRMTERRRESLREWVGGRLSPPLYVEDRDEPYRPDLVVWMELPSGLVVGQDVVVPEKVEGAVGRVLRDALERPLAGPPRRPDVIRVSDAGTAADVRAAVGDSIPVTVAPTPELDELLDLMLESMAPGDVEASYLEEGRIPPATVARLFSSAALLYRLAPWKVATDDQVLRMDIPALGVNGACVCIIGNLGESLGVLVFPSLAGYQAFERAAARPKRSAARRDMGTDWLALSFERGADLSATQRREVATHGWKVAGAHAYPVVARYDRDGCSRPPVERDLKIAAACATSLTAFFAKHKSLFEVDEFEPVCESWFDNDDLEVRFTIPYDAFDMFEIEPDPVEKMKPPAAPKTAKLGRNDPCYCGSGRKYKHCHLPLDEQESATRGEGHPLHNLDRRLVDSLCDFAAKRFGSAWWGFEEDFVDAEESAQLSILWAVYHYRVDGATVLDHYIEEKGRRLPSEEREWLEAQRASWLSVWEVIRVEPGESVTLRDLISGEERQVSETGASQTLVARDALLGRVVDYGGVSLLCGTHPQPLPPVPTAEVVRLARANLRRKRLVPPERLRDERFGRALIRHWEKAVASLHERPPGPRELRNTDGEAILLTTDHFDIAPGATSAVETQLAALPGVEPPEPGESPPAYTFVRPGNRMHEHWDNTVIGHARVSGQALRVETNSRERADALRQLIEAACGDRIRHRLREHTDPLSEKAARGRRDTEPRIPPADAEKILREFKTRHYTAWLDEPIPALGGKTPREAAKTTQGRAAVDLLLKDIENLEQRGREAAPFDVSWLRVELGLDDAKKR